MELFKQLLFIVTVCDVIGICYTLECYSCDGDIHKSCLDPVDVSNMVVQTCISVLYEDPVCIKASTIDSTMTIRYCANRTTFGKPVCESTLNFYKQKNVHIAECSTCDHNLCNSAASIGINFLLFLTAMRFVTFL